MPGQSELMQDIPGIHLEIRKASHRKKLAAAVSAGAVLALASTAGAAVRPDPGQIQRPGAYRPNPGQIQHPSFFRPYPGQIQQYARFFLPNPGQIQ